MKPLTPRNMAMIGIVALLVSACATRTVVVPKHSQQHVVVKKHVVYHARPAHKHCWRHRGHWDCR